MTGLAAEQPASTPRSALLLPIAYLAHLAEEWFGGFLAWTPATLGYEISATRFVLINGVALALFVGGTIAAFRYPRSAGWFGASLAALLGLNGLLHALATIGFGRYSPGVFTGLFVYVPLSIVVLRSYAGRLQQPALGRAIAVGVILHAMVALLAFL